MPFSSNEFFAVFGAYNSAIWPAQILASVVGLLILALLLRPSRAATIAVTGLLALMWLTNGLVYHGLFFSTINPAAYLFALLFMIEGLLLLSAPFVWKTLRFGIRRNARSCAGVALSLFALLVYPLWGWTAGQVWPQAPMFGVAPCPTTIFTIGVLLMANRPGARRWLLVIPTLWALIGGSAAILLEVPQDYGLIAALVTIFLIVASDALRRKPRELETAAR